MEWPNARNCEVHLSKLPNAVGVIDGTSHEICKSLNENKEHLYSGHRGYQCLHTQVVITNNRKLAPISSVFLGYNNDAGCVLQMPTIHVGLNATLEIMLFIG